MCVYHFVYVCIFVCCERAGELSLFPLRVVNVFGVVAGGFAGAADVRGSRPGLGSSRCRRRQ